MRITLVLAIATVAWSCNQGPLSAKKDAEKTNDDPSAGTLAVGDQAGAGIDVAAANLTTVSESFVPKSMQQPTAGTVEVDTGSQLALQGGPPIFCQNNPGHQMCTDCGPGGALSGQQACADFFGPGGEGYTEGETLGGGGQGDGGQGDGGQGDGGQGDGGQGDGGQGPCQGLGFFDCQPVLVKLYLKVAQDSVGHVNGTLEHAKQLVKGIKDSSGTVTIPDDGEFSAVDYKIAAQDDMAFLFKDKNGKATVHLAIKGSSYSLTSVQPVVDENSGTSKSGQSTVKVEFIDASNWTTDFFVDFGECSPEDVQAPQRINIKMKRTATVWAGKAMMHSPRWPRGTCDTPITDTSGINIDTDIIGEDAFTTAALYMVPLSVEKLDASNIAAYGIDKVCDHIADFCNEDGKLNQYDEAPPSNPFCSKPDGSVAFDTACTESTVPEVKAGTFGSQDLWTAPKQMEAVAVEVPAAI